jgi:hypothetical protein
MGDGETAPAVRQESAVRIPVDTQQAEARKVTIERS